MKTFKALYIDNGVIKAGEFPVEPDLCFLPFCETDGTDIEYCKCHELETEYERAIREAKANAVECEDQKRALSLAVATCPLDAIIIKDERAVGVKDGIYRLFYGWDYRVEEVPEYPIDHTSYPPYKKVAILYHTDEQIKLDRLGNTSSPVIQTEESQEEIWRKFFLELIKGGDISYLSIIEGTLIKKAAEKYTITRKP